MSTITSTDHAEFADALFGNEATLIARLRTARQALAAAELRLAEFDEDTAGGVHPWIAADAITLAVWKAAHSDACRQLVLDRIERCAAAVAAAEGALARLRTPYRRAA